MQKNLLVVAFSLGCLTSGYCAVVPNESLILPDKNLPKEWVKSLYERGKPRVVTSRQGLMHVGMPVGGLFCGTVYLGGDGKLWLWDIFNDNREGIVPKLVKREVTGTQQTLRNRDGAAYYAPESTQPSLFQRGFPLTRMNVGDVAGFAPGSARESNASDGGDPLDYSNQDHFQQGFAIKTGNQVRSLDVNGWKQVSFTGSYPIGTVKYSDPQSPVTVKLEGYSPFIPLNTKDSSLPCTIMSYTIANVSNQVVVGEIGGWLENGVCCNSGFENPLNGTRVNSVLTGNSQGLLMTANSEQKKITSSRKDIPFEDFEKDNYGSWKVEGTAFDQSPLDNARIPGYMGQIGMQGSRAAVSHNVRSGGDVNAGDGHKGRLTSPEFTIERKYINFMIAGGNRPKEVGLRLLIDGKTVKSAAGRNSNKLRFDYFDVSAYQGQKAQLVIEDNATGGWGNVIVDDIVFSDVPEKTSTPVEKAADYGSFFLAVSPHDDAETRYVASLPPKNTAEILLSGKKGVPKVNVGFINKAPIGGISRSFHLQPGESTTATFVIAWHFPNVYLHTKGDSGTVDGSGKQGGRHYAAYFKNAADVGQYVIENLPRLSQETHDWRDTWYDSTLPYWFLDRTFANTSTLATTTCHRFKDGRFYAWEGIGACAGTCTHVWQYAQAPARLFPDIERYTREFVDLGIGWTADLGRIGMRAEHHMGPAIDGQCGRIMGMWREHTMSADDSFLKRIWPKAKKSVQYVLNQDTDKDGILDTAQDNTLDAAWFGKIAWTSIEALGAWRAGEEMALEMGDVAFAEECRNRIIAGRRNIEKELFNGKWFIQKPQPGKENVFGSYNGSFIDQLFGQSMAYQCGLGTLVSPAMQKKALQSIWQNNFSFDLGPYIKTVKPVGRAYCLPGEGGVLMCTNALNEENPYGGGSWTHGYFNECMTGFEHQYASHLMKANMVTEALAVTRAIHDRHDAEKRNPYNEIECSDHYARAMASYGTFVNACGYSYHGPRGKMSFDPRISPGNFKAAFTAAEGWGTYRQVLKSGKPSAEIVLKYGRLVLRELSLACMARQSDIRVLVDGKPVPFKLQKNKISFNSPVTLSRGTRLVVSVASGQ